MDPAVTPEPPDFESRATGCVELASATRVPTAERHTGPSVSILDEVRRRAAA